MTTPLLLVAAGGLAREVLALLAARPDLAVRGLLDDAPDLQGRLVAGVEVIGPLAAVDRHVDAQLLLCAGRGRVRRLLAERLRARGVGDERYATLVAPGAIVPAGCRVGAGSVLAEHVVLTADVTVGRHVVVMPNVTLTHDDVLADFVTVCAGVSLGGGVQVGPAAYLGMNASVRERTRIGADAVLGMGAALLRDLPDGQTWTGVPARPRELGSHPHPHNFESGVLR